MGKGWGWGFRMDYTYNIRGWLTQIDNPASFLENDKFGLQLYYNTAPTGGTAAYNGNISGMKWGTPANSNMLYRFAYDGLNRLTSADFEKPGYAYGAFDSWYNYDDNGNFTEIQRRKLDGGDLDVLLYEYNGNRIGNIDDYSEDVPNVVDYPGVFMSAEQLDYDANGNMYFEPYKHFSVRYNLLNLPSEVYFSTNRRTKYFYTFNGEKLRQTVEDNGVLTKVDYCGPFVYETVSGVRSLKFIVTPEGRAVKNGSNWDHEYNLTDHLGNVRAVIKKGANGLAEAIQERHYFPFGMEMSELSSGSSTNKYQYNGKELQNDFALGMYDYGARFYDPAIGRWHSVDPSAESYYSWTPYNYCANNPINNIDPDGMDWYTNRFTGDQKWYDDNKWRLMYSHNEGGSYTAPETTITGTSKETRIAAAESYEYEQNLNQQGIETYRTDSRLEAFASMVSLGALPEGKGLFSLFKTTKAVPVANEISQVAEGISKVINAGKQGKHILGHNNYQVGRSILTEDAQKLLDGFHSGNVNSVQVINDVKTRVDFGKTIGTYINPQTNEVVSTTRGIIINSKTGVHIIPSSPN